MSIVHCTKTVTRTARQNEWERISCAITVQISVTFKLASEHNFLFKQAEPQQSLAIYIYLYIYIYMHSIYIVESMEYAMEAYVAYGKGAVHFTC